MSTQVNDRFRDYVPVSERLERFYTDHPEGRVLTSIVEHDAENGFVLIRAEIYREKDDATPASTGHAFENRSEGYVNKTSYIENCETSATGRALALLGYEIKRGIASREEMEKTERMGSNGTGGQPEQTCPECGDSKSVIKGKAEYGGGYLCFKKKGGCGAKWGNEPITEGYSKDQMLRDEYFNHAEKLMAGMEEGKRKEALGRLLMLNTEQMGQKVDELAENARKKAHAALQTDEGFAGTREEERRTMIEEIKHDAAPEKLAAYIDKHYPGKAWTELSFDAIKQIHEEFVVPF